jgi:hypothetical protein
MKSRHQQDTFHIAPDHALPCDGHHPLTDHELLELRRTFTDKPGFYTAMSILRRIEQAVPGMVTPIFAAGPGTIACAREAVETFGLWARTGEPALHAKLLTLLGIQAELQLEEAA